MLTTTDYQLSAARTAHGHLVRLRNELNEKIVLQWLRDNRKHPKAQAVDTVITLYRLHGDLLHLRDAIDYVDLHTESTLP
jgi:hypothetical protein